jgi:hypothetical protein
MVNRPNPSKKAVRAWTAAIRRAYPHCEIEALPFQTFVNFAEASEKSVAPNEALRDENDYS